MKVIEIPKHVSPEEVYKKIQRIQRISQKKTRLKDLKNQ